MQGAPILTAGNEPTWHPSGRGAVPVSKMENGHVRNALRWLRTRLPTYKPTSSRREWALHWITIFEGELVRRRIMRMKGTGR